MPTLFKLPPNVVDLVWTPDGDTFVAKSTKAWLVLWTITPSELFEMGFSTGTGYVDGSAMFQVHWTPSRARAAYADDLALLEEVHAEAIGHAKRLEADLVDIAARRVVERDAAEKADEAAQVERAKLVQSLRNDAAVYLAMMADGMTVRQHQLLTSLVGRDELHDTDIAQMQRVFAALEGEAS